MPTFDDHFAPQASQYAAFRPTYPDALIAQLAALAPDRKLAWDVGTGSGQAAVLLAAHFDHVEATDASASQIAHAVPHARVTYRVARAEQSPLGDASADLVTVAQALHWFDLPAFYHEVDRVLRPGGVLAVWSYGLLEIDADVDAVVWWFYEKRLGRNWPEERRHIENHYADLAFPYPALHVDDAPIIATLTRAQLVGYISTWSALKRARDVEANDPLLEFVQRLEPVWPSADEARTSRWPVTVRAGRKA